MEDILLVVLGTILIVVIAIIRIKNKAEEAFKSEKKECITPVKDLFTEIFLSQNQIDKDYSCPFENDESKRKETKMVIEKQSVKTISDLAIHNEIIERSFNKGDNDKKITQQKKISKKVDLKKAIIYKTILDHPYH